MPRDQQKKSAKRADGSPAGPKNELDRRTRELREALERQAATAGILHIISRSPNDAQPVFEAIVQSGVRLFPDAAIFIALPDGDMVKAAALAEPDSARAEAWRGRFPFPLTREYMHGIAILDARVVDFPDVAAASPDIAVGAKNFLASGYRAITIMPLLRGNTAIGTISLVRLAPGQLSDEQLAVLKTFADQAVIAIENTRLVNELRQRTDDLGEALEQQTAASDVLGVIASSAGELGPVFQAILENATRLCEAKFGNLALMEDGALRMVALVGAPAAYAEERRRSPTIPLDAVIGRLVATRQRIHIADITADESIASGPIAKLAGARTLLVVPLFKEAKLVGVLGIYRQEVRPFTDKQIELLQNFANQAVIAIENARLLSELRQRTADLSEALEQQTATSEVLKVISSSPGDLAPVFQAMLENAVKLCEAKFGILYRYEDHACFPAAMVNAPPAYAEFVRERGRFLPQSGNALDRVLQTKRLVHSPDVSIETVPTPSAKLAGARSQIIVPMLKDDALIGAIAIFRQEARPFSEKQIALLTSFAAQAVIAVENTRLLTELRQRTTDLSEALEQQTATSEVLQVISSSPGDLEPVFQNLLKNATHVCRAQFGNLVLCEGDGFRNVAIHNAVPALDELFRGQLLHPHPESPLALAARLRRPSHVTDVRETPPYLAGNKPIVVLADVGGARTFVCVPMLRESEVVGVIILYRTEVRPFTDKQIELVNNFAKQAVIAIENTRLLNELEKKSQELLKLNQQLEQRVSDQVSEIERMGRLRRFLPPQVADLIVSTGAESQLESHRREITALFCDLRGFTGFSESADPEDVMALLRQYHAAIGEIIFKHGGTLERFVGDGVMVIFNDPIPLPNPSLHAVQMALDMRTAIGALVETWRRMGHDIGFGIGISHGYATLGTIGFEGRFDYAAIGTVSNVASRLCDEAKSGQILISPRVLMAIGDAVTVEPAGELTLKGIRRPMEVHNVVDASGRS